METFVEERGGIDKNNTNTTAQWILWMRSAFLSFMCDILRNPELALLTTSDSLRASDVINSNTTQWKNKLTSQLWKIAMVTAKQQTRQSKRVASCKFSHEGVHLTLPLHIFSVHVKSGACYITGQWGRVQNKIKET